MIPAPPGTFATYTHSDLPDWEIPVVAFNQHGEPLVIGKTRLELAADHHFGTERRYAGIAGPETTDPIVHVAELDEPRPVKWRDGTPAVLVGWAFTATGETCPITGSPYGPAVWRATEHREDLDTTPIGPGAR